jgi:hypothetical protein
LRGIHSAHTLPGSNCIHTQLEIFAHRQLRNGAVKVSASEEDEFDNEKNTYRTAALLLHFLAIDAEL